jgi:hypothetical protein
VFDLYKERILIRNAVEGMVDNSIHLHHERCSNRGPQNVKSHLIYIYYYKCIKYNFNNIYYYINCILYNTLKSICIRRWQL